MKIKVPKPVKAYGYSARWSDGTIGWFTSRFPSTSRKFPDDIPNLAEAPTTSGERFFLCEIKIKPLIDKKGRPITKIQKKG